MKSFLIIVLLYGLCGMVQGGESKLCSKKDKTLLMGIINKNDPNNYEHFLRVFKTNKTEKIAPYFYSCEILKIDSDQQFYAIRMKASLDGGPGAMRDFLISFNKLLGVSHYRLHRDTGFREFECGVSDLKYELEGYFKIGKSCYVGVKEVRSKYGCAGQEPAFRESLLFFDNENYFTTSFKVMLTDKNQKLSSTSSKNKCLVKKTLSPCHKTQTQCTSLKFNFNRNGKKDIRLLKQDRSGSLFMTTM